jgi:hypothetical protein
VAVEWTLLAKAALPLVGKVASSALGRPRSRVVPLASSRSVMQHGRIVETNTTRELVAAPRHDYTKMLLGSTLDGAPLRAPLSPIPQGV